MYHDSRYQALETAAKVIGKPDCSFTPVEIMNSMPYCPICVSRIMNSTPETLSGFLCTDTLPESKNQRGWESTEEKWTKEQSGSGDSENGECGEGTESSQMRIRTP